MPPLPLAGEGWGEGVSRSQDHRLTFIANQDETWPEPYARVRARPGLRHTCGTMRLTPEQQRELHTALRHCFGESARLWLFGSRTDDTARGGDYDLLVQTDEPDAALLIEAKLAFLAELHGTPAFDGERVDVVLHSRALDPQPRPIHRAALAQGIEIT